MYIPSLDPNRPESPENEDLIFFVTYNNITRTVEYDEDGAFIVKSKGKTLEHDLTDEQWDQIEAQVNLRLGL